MKTTLPSLAPGDFCFAAAHFDHGHIYPQIDGLAEAGATLKYVYDPFPERYARVLQKYPGARVVDCLERILEDTEVRLVTAAAIPDQRCAIGLQVLGADKDYFTAKCPFTTLAQLAAARAAVRSNTRRYMVFYSERLHSKSGWQASQLIREGAIGRVVQVLNLAPHNLQPASRPPWFFQKRHYGGILTDIGSHQFEQFLAYSAASGGQVVQARVENFCHPEYPELEDFGEASLIMDNGVSAYCRVDWLNPRGSKVWGDGRTFVLGTNGYLEIRKYRDLVHGGADRIYLVDDCDEKVIDCSQTGGSPFFPLFLRDCLDRTEHAMTQEHAFRAAELSLQAQALADAGRCLRLNDLSPGRQPGTQDPCTNIPAHPPTPPT